MLFKLQAGDVIRIKKGIDHEIKSCAWKTGYYRLTRIGNMMNKGELDPRLLSYTFEKIRKDGTAYTSLHWVGYSAQEFDKMDNWEKV